MSQIFGNQRSFGFDHTLNVGVINGINLYMFSQNGVAIGGGIQTDAVINLTNRILIGINTTIFTQIGKLLFMLYGY